MRLKARLAFFTLFLACSAFSVGAQEQSAGGPVRILALGDSLTAGYGLPAQDGFVAQLGDALAAAGHDVVMIDAGVSGDTTAGGLSRLDWALAGGADVAIIELGANDALRGIDPASSRANLDGILAALGGRGIPALLAGIYAPRNLGPEYVAAFDAMYPELAAEHDAILYPFFLEGVAADPTLNQGDGIHPNPRGVVIIVENMLPDVIALIERAGEGS
ncbi:MAG: arylesterase [Alphaproteobacteria bacterium]|nr:arylesterase [Alphaproteobacteria bacterium]